MNSPTENATPPANPAAADSSHPSEHPENWREALMALIASRISLIRLEARETARQRAKRVVCVIAAVICLFFTWALLIAGGIGAIAAISGWPWHWLAIGAAGLHLVAAVILAGGSSKPAAPAFPLTRAEFQKDREWIETLQKKPKSNA
jgi:MFS family permease